MYNVQDAVDVWLLSCNLQRHIFQYLLHTILASVYLFQLSCQVHIATHTPILLNFCRSLWCTHSQHHNLLWSWTTVQSMERLTLGTLSGHLELSPSFYLRTLQNLTLLRRFLEMWSSGCSEDATTWMTLWYQQSEFSERLLDLSHQLHVKHTYEGGQCTMSERQSLFHQPREESFQLPPNVMLLLRSIQSLNVSSVKSKSGMIKSGVVKSTSGPVCVLIALLDDGCDSGICVDARFTVRSGALDAAEEIGVEVLMHAAFFCEVSAAGFDLGLETVGVLGLHVCPCSDLTATAPHPRAAEDRGSRESVTFSSDLTGLCWVGSSFTFVGRGGACWLFSDMMCTKCAWLVDGRLGALTVLVRKFWGMPDSVVSLLPGIAFGGELMSRATSRRSLIQPRPHFWDGNPSWNLISAISIPWSFVAVPSLSTLEPRSRSTPGLPCSTTSWQSDFTAWVIWVCEELLTDGAIGSCGDPHVTSDGLLVEDLFVGCDWNKLQRQ